MKLLQSIFILALLFSLQLHPSAAQAAQIKAKMAEAPMVELKDIKEIYAKTPNFGLTDVKKLSAAKAARQRDLKCKDAAEYIPDEPEMAQQQPFHAHSPLPIAAPSDNSALAQLYKTKLPLKKKQEWPNILEKMVRSARYLAPSKKIPLENPSRTILWNRDLTRMANIFKDWTAVSFLDAQTGKKLCQFPFTKEEIYTAALSNDGRRIAMVPQDDASNAGIWDVQTGAQSLALPKDVLAVAWHPDDARIAIATEDGDDGDLTVFNAQHGQELLHLPKIKDQGIEAIAFDPFSTRIAFATRKGVYIYDTQSPSQPLAKLGLKSRDDESPLTLAWNHDSTRLAIMADDSVYIWNTSTKAHKLFLSDSASFAPAHWPQSPPVNGAYQLPLSSLRVNEIAWSPTNNCIAIACIGCAYIYDASTGALLYIIPHENYSEEIDSIAWHCNGTRIATGSSTSVCFWDIDPQGLTQFSDLIHGTLAPEQLMLVHLFDQFRKHPSNEVRPHLNHVAEHAHTPGITTAELARVLLTFHPLIQDELLSYFNISCNKLPNSDAHIEDYRDSYQAFVAAQSIVPLGAKDDIKTALEEYTVDKRQTIKPKPQPAGFAKLEEERKNQSGESFRKVTTQKLFVAVKGRDLKTTKENLNSVSIVDRNPNENLRTPLMHAIWLHDPELHAQDGDEIFNELLNYKKVFKVGASIELSQSDLAATDFDGCTPLMLAVIKDCFNFALKIAQKMDQNKSLHPAFAQQRRNGNALESAYDLAVKVEAKNRDNADYQALMKILEKQRIKK